MTSSLYLHVPFCAGACDYCDFYSVAVHPDDELLDRFPQRLLADTKQQLLEKSIDQVPTVFIGGGTPSILGPRRMAFLLSSLFSLIPNRPQEITIEANPESFTEDFLQAVMDAGLGKGDRLSLGIQSLNPRSRDAVHRLGTVEAALSALERAGKRFRGDFNADLMAGLPFQTTASLCSDIDRVLDSGASHISLYSLILEDGTPLAQRVNRGLASLPNPDEADTLWLTGRDYLEKRGMKQYEVSNFALSGHECRHNLRYWHMESWLGAGPAASGTLVDETTATAVRWTESADIASWISGAGTVETEALSREDLLEESLIMGFRLRSGPDPVLFRKRFGFGIEDCVGNTIAKWRNRGLFEEGSIALSKEGLLFLDPFLLDCLSELGQ